MVEVLHQTALFAHNSSFDCDQESRLWNISGLFTVETYQLRIATCYRIFVRWASMRG
jgi:hypothetical protein